MKDPNESLYEPVPIKKRVESGLKKTVVPGAKKVAAGIGNWVLYGDHRGKPVKAKPVRKRAAPKAPARSTQIARPQAPQVVYIVKGVETSAKKKRAPVRKAPKSVYDVW